MRNSGRVFQTDTIKPFFGAVFALGMARAMYAKTLTDTRDEVTSTLSTGISINHFVSIIIAILGGILWEVLGTEVLFSLAAVFAFGSFIFSLTLPRSGVNSRN